MKMYRVKEVFGPTIQGEGTHAGRVVKFLRLAGCNRWTGRPEDREKAVCTFCDTDFLGGDKLTALDIVERLDALGPVKTVVISGGEPTLQLDLELVRALRVCGYELHLETNGSKDLGELGSYFQHITVSPKQSFEQTKLRFANDLKVLFPCEIPGVTPHGFDDFPSMARFVQPIDTGRDGANIDNRNAAVKFCLENPEWKLSLQLHKMLGVQ